MSLKGIQKLYCFLKYFLCIEPIIVYSSGIYAFVFTLHYSVSKTKTYMEQTPIISIPFNAGEQNVRVNIYAHIRCFRIICLC